MNKPWDNEPTPISDKMNYRVVLAEDIRPLERRLRHAESILRWIEDKPVSDIGFIVNKTRAYLKAVDGDNA